MVIKEIVLTTSKGGKLIHGFLDDSRGSVIILINRLTTGEVYIRVLCCPTHGWPIWSQSSFAMRCNEIFIDHLKHVIIGELLNLLNFSRGPETIKEMHEGNAGLKGGLGGNKRHVLTFLNVLRAKHAPTRLTSGVNVTMVTKNGKTLTGDGASCNMEYGRSKLTGNLIHIRNKKEQALRCGKSSTKCA